MLKYEGVAEVAVGPLGRVREVRRSARRRQRRGEPPPHPAALADARDVDAARASEHAVHHRARAARAPGRLPESFSLLFLKH